MRFKRGEKSTSIVLLCCCLQEGVQPWSYTGPRRPALTGDPHAPASHRNPHSRSR